MTSGNDEAGGRDLNLKVTNLMAFSKKKLKVASFSPTCIFLSIQGPFYMDYTASGI